MIFNKLLSLTASAEEIRKGKRLLAVEMFGQNVGCSNGNCVFGHLGGMHTNGACHCAEDAVRYEKFIKALGPYFNDSFNKTKRNL